MRRPQLTADQKQQVAEANHYNNLQNCLEGIGDCNHALLSSDEQQNLARETHNRDLQRCLEGSDTCDPSQLIIATPNSTRSP